MGKTNKAEARSFPTSSVSLELNLLNVFINHFSAVHAILTRAAKQPIQISDEMSNAAASTGFSLRVLGKRIIRTTAFFSALGMCLVPCISVQANSLNSTERSARQNAHHSDAISGKPADRSALSNSMPDDLTSPRTIEEFVLEKEAASKSSRRNAENRTRNKVSDGAQFYFDSRGNPHPSESTEAATRILIVNSVIPEVALLNGCVRDIRDMGANSSSVEALVQNSKLLSKSVFKDISFYHWCFYYFMAALDWKLEEIKYNTELQKKRTCFVENAKGLWLLARALDDAVKSNIYFDFLKFRYVRMTKIHFGKSVNVISPPVGNPLWIDTTKGAERRSLAKHR